MFTSLELGVNFSIFMSSLLSDVSSFDISLHSLRSDMFIKSAVLKDCGMSSYEGYDNSQFGHIMINFFSSYLYLSKSNVNISCGKNYFLPKIKTAINIAIRISRFFRISLSILSSYSSLRMARMMGAIIK